MTRRMMREAPLSILACALLVAGVSAPASAQTAGLIGKEVSVARHRQNGEEVVVSPSRVIEHGKLLFEANWTAQEGNGRPLTKGTGKPLSDPTDPLTFPRDFNRISAMDANSCFGCHNVPRSGGGGDIVANVFVTGQRFDFATFDHSDLIPTKGAVNELGEFVTLNNVANSRLTLSMFGSGFIEMLTREITTDLQAIRDGIGAGSCAALTSKGISFGELCHNADGSWDTSGVEGLVAGSLSVSDDAVGPGLQIRPFHQASNVISVREFSNNAFNHHHGIQTEERFGTDVDADGDGFVNEMTIADVTAAAIFQVQLAVPGRVIPDDPDVEAAVLLGEQVFVDIGCTNCHKPRLALNDWIFVEPNPFNPDGNLGADDDYEYAIDLTSPALDQPRLRPRNGVVQVPAFTDLKVHDLSTGPDDPNCEPINMNANPGTDPAGFNGGNCRFITRKLWGIANEKPFFHHGKFTTMRQTIEAHHGAAQAQLDEWNALSDTERDAVIEFLKTLQVLPEDTGALVINEHGQPKRWPQRLGGRKLGS